MRVKRMATRWLMMLMTVGSLAGTGVAFQNPPAPPTVAVVDYDMRKAATPPSLSEDELRGKKLFVQRCALCHDLLGQPASTTVGPWVDAETVKSRGEARVRDQITKGSRRMPGWQYTFDAPQINQLIAYLKTVTPDQKPKPRGSVTIPID
jgi:mono/diheme cytochrome c family protein